jgi:MoaA/NifB/PqqE/SkfB family radical SAM enzyme
MNLTQEEVKQLRIEKALFEKEIREVRYPGEFSFPVGLQFELTSACNLKCKHCYNRSGDSDKKTLMTPEKWKEFARYIVKKGGIFQCIISGGEPLLLGEDLFEIMDILHQDGTGFLLITNGYFVTPEIVDALSKYRYYRLQVSIDGSNAALHDGFRGVPGSFKKACEAALLFAAKGMPVSIAHSVTPENLDKLEEMAELSYLLGASMLMIGKIMPSGRATQNREIILNEFETKKMENKITVLQKKYSGRMTIQGSMSDILQLNKSAISPPTVAIIRPNGDVRVDCVAPIVAGSILQEDFCEIWNRKFKNVWQDARALAYLNEVNNTPEENLSVINHVTDDIIL